MEHRSSSHIVADVNDGDIHKGQCHHFSIREYVRQMQMSKSTFFSLSHENINSPLITTKTFLRWNCESCTKKLEHAVRKELSQEKGSEKCHSPSSYNKESTELDRAINDLRESTPINQENKESADPNPAINGLDEASPSNPDGTKKMPSNVDFMDVTNPPYTCQKMEEKKEVNDKEKLEFLHGEPMLGRSKKGNSVKSPPVKRKYEPHARLHDTDKNVIKTYKRRKNTKVHDSIIDSSFVDSQDRSESNRAGNSKEKYAVSIMQPDLLCPGVSLTEGNIPYTTDIMDGDESIQNNGVYQTPCSFENELDCSKMYLSKVSPGKSEQTHRKTIEDKEDEHIITSAKEASTGVQSEKSYPEFSQLEQQQICHLHSELPLGTTEDEDDYCVLTSGKEVSTRLQSGKSQNPEFTWLQHQQFQHLHNEVSLGNATEDEEDNGVITSVKDVSTRLQSGESHHQYNGENFTSYRENSNLNGSFPPTMNFSEKYQHPQNFSKPFLPAPRIGVRSLTLQKEVASYSESCGPESGYQLGMSEEETPWQMYRGENMALSRSQVPAYCSPQHLGYSTSIAIPESEGESSDWTKIKRVHPSDNKSSEEESALCLCLSLGGHECCT